MSVFFKYAIASYKAVGFWPIKTKSKILIFLHNCYFALTMSLAVVLVITMFMEIPNALQHGLKLLGNVVAVGCQFGFSLIQMWVCALPRMKYLIQQMQVTEKNIFKYGSPDIKCAYLEYVKVNYIINRIVWCCALTCLICFIIIPVIIQVKDLGDPEDPPPLPFDLWVPFDKYENYKIIFAWCCVQGLPIAFVVIATSTTYLGLMIFSSSQLRILKCEIIYGIDTKKFSDREIYQNIRKAVTYHINILRFVENFNTILKYPMLLAVLIFVVNTAMTSFEIATESLSFPLVKNICYLICTLLELFFFYWYANDISMENENLVNAIWESDWYNCNTKIKKSLMIMTMRIQRPLRLSVGGFYYMSMTTMIMILKSSVSYAVTLTQFHSLKHKIEAN